MTIEKVCRKCYGHAVSKTDLAKGRAPVELLSPTGTAHRRQPDDPSMTECGLDSAGWPLVEGRETNPLRSNRVVARRPR